MTGVKKEADEVKVDAGLLGLTYLFCLLKIISLVYLPSGKAAVSLARSK